jgi:hypothetical protein
MNERIKQLAEQAGAEELGADLYGGEFIGAIRLDFLEKFAELIVRKCIDKIETHRISVGNSAAGEMACEWTYSALKEIRDEIKEHFGVEE